MTSDGHREKLRSVKNTNVRARKSNIRSAVSPEFGFDLIEKHRVKAFLDIGANAGLVAIKARMLLPDAKIIAVEPAPKALSCFKNNVRDFGIKVDESVVANGSDVQFRQRAYSPASSICPRDEKSTPAKSVSINALFERYKLDPSTTYVKLDIEGGEYYVLRDAGQVGLLATCYAVSVEYHRKTITEMNGDRPWWSDQQFFHWGWETFRETHWVATFGNQIAKLTAVSK